MGLWILRRLELRIDAHAALSRRRDRESTWCCGIGARWAERTTQLRVRRPVVRRGRRDLGAHRSASAARRSPLPAGLRRGVGRDRGRAQGVGPAAPSRRRRPMRAARAWPLRATDIDVVGHVNNAAYWAAVEDELAAPGPAARAHAPRSSSGPGSTSPTRSSSPSPTPTTGFAAWLCVGGDVRASVLVGCEACSTT